MRDFFVRERPKYSGLLSTEYGILRRVDRWNLEGDVEFLSKGFIKTGIPFALGIGVRSGSGSLPAEGSFVEVTNCVSSGTSTQSYITAVLPSHVGTAWELNTFQQFKTWPKVRPQFPFLVPGSWHAQAEDLSNLQLIERVGFMMELPDNQRFWVTFHDHQMLHESLLHTKRGSGFLQKTGFISRPLAEDHQYMTTAGQYRNYVTPKIGGTLEKFLNEDDEGSRPLLEQYLMLWETSNSVIPFVRLDEKGMDEFKYDLEKKPLIVEISGTVVGPHKSLSDYGKIWYATVFDSVNDKWPSNPRFTGFQPKLDKDRLAYQLSLAKVLYLPRVKSNGAFFALDKQGKLFVKLGMSARSQESQYKTSGIEQDPLGSHRSLEALLMGSVKMHIGKNWDQERSIDLSTDGQCRYRIGKDSGSKGQQSPLMISIDTSTEGKVKLRIRDDSGAVDQQLLSVDMVTTRGIRLVVQGPATRDSRAIDVEAVGKVHIHATNDIKVFSDTFVYVHAPRIHLVGDQEVHINP